MTTIKKINTALFLLLCAAAFIPGISLAEIRFGVLPRLSSAEMFSMLGPLAEYLTRETGETVSIVIPRDFDSFKTAVRAGQIDLGFANPLIYLQLRKDLEIVPLAVSAEPRSGTKFRGIIIARKDSGIEKPQDLVGKKLIFVEKDSAAGYLFQMLFLSKAGLDVHSDFTTLPFAKKHDNVVLAVFNKAADAGGIREDDLVRMKDRVDLSQLRIVATTDAYPNWPVFATPALTAASAEKIKAALLKLAVNKPESLRILGRAMLSGFGPVQDKDYDQLRQAAKLVGAL